MMFGINDKLTAVLDPRTSATLFTFTKGSGFDLPIKRSANIITLPNVDYGFNGRGAYANPVDPTQITWSFFYLYDGTYPNWGSLRTALDLAMGHGEIVTMQRTDAAGGVWLANGYMTALDGKGTTTTMVNAEFTLTFQQLQSWRSQYPSNTVLYDADYLYDNGVQYDQVGTIVTLTGAQQDFTAVNNGSAKEFDVTLFFIGPIVGPIVLSNYSADVFGNRFPYSASNPNPNPMYVQINDSVSANFVATTLNGAFIIGQGAIAVASLAGFALGQPIVIDTAGNQEVNTIVGLSGIIVTLATPLTKNHISGVIVQTSNPDIYAINARTRAVTTTKAGVIAYDKVTTPKGQRALFAIMPGTNYLHFAASTGPGYGGIVQVIGNDRQH